MRQKDTNDRYDRHKEASSGLYLFSGFGRDAGKPEGAAQPRLPDGVVVGQVHELIDQLWIDVARQGTENSTTILLLLTDQRDRYLLQNGQTRRANDGDNETWVNSRAYFSISRNG